MIPISTLNANICRVLPNLGNKYILCLSEKNTLYVLQEMLITLGSLQLSGGQIFSRGTIIFPFWLLSLNATWQVPAPDVGIAVKKCF